MMLSLKRNVSGARFLQTGAARDSNSASIAR